MQQINIIIPTLPPDSILVIMQQFFHPFFYPYLYMSIKYQISIFNISQKSNKLLIQLFIKLIRRSLIFFHAHAAVYFINKIYNFIPIYLKQRLRNQYGCQFDKMQKQNIQKLIYLSSVIIKQKQVQMASQLKKEIIQYCQQLNERCELEFEDFCFQNLSSREWYISILETLFPHLQQNFKNIQDIEQEHDAFIQIISLINRLDQFQRLSINSQKLIKGDVNEIGKLVQAIVKLFQIAMEEYEEQIHENQQNQPHDNKFKKQTQQTINKNHKSHSDVSKSKSVQAIVHEFDKSQQQQQINILRDQQKLNPSKKKPINQTNDRKPSKKIPPKTSNEDQESQNQYYQNIISNSKKVNGQLKSKNPQAKALVSQSKKILVTHPKSPQTLKKAKSIDAVALTNKIQQDIKKTKKKQRNRADLIRGHDSTESQMKRKAKQYDYVTKQREKQRAQQKILKEKRKDYSQKNQKNLQKILNWREQKIKRERKEYEQSLKMKLINKKEQYVKKINKLILQLEREKMIEEKKQFKENLIKQNEQAVKKLVSIEQEYKNKLNLFKQNRKAKKQQRLMVKTGHKEIINQIQRYLKKENEQKLLKLTDQYRNQQNNIETDYQELERKIIKAYQKN